jgi:hypothetical protein
MGDGLISAKTPVSGSGGSSNMIRLCLVCKPMNAEFGVEPGEIARRLVKPSVEPGRVMSSGFGGRGGAGNDRI